MSSRRLSWRVDNTSELKGQNTDSAKSPEVAVGQDFFEASLLCASGEAESRKCVYVTLFVDDTDKD